MFILLLGGDKEFANQLLNLFINYLNNGWTFKDIKSEILKVFYTHQNFRWNMFDRQKANGNLLKFGTKYFHKQLKIINKPPVINYDINNGTMVSRTEQYYLEPVASYTTQDFIQYFYSNVPVDLQAQPPTKMTGIFNYKINQYGIDKLLFMTDLCAEHCNTNQTKFSLGTFDEYSSIADAKMAEIKSVINDTDQYYVPKQRRLFDSCAR